MGKILSVIIMFCLMSCASVAPVYKQDYDFSKIKTFYVESFGDSNVAATVRNAVIKQLMLKGFGVRSASGDDVDMVIAGTVSQYQPSKTYLVRDHQNTPNAIIYNDNPFEISGSSIYDSGTAFGMGDAKLYSTTATLGLSISMKDPKTREIVWTNSYTYEGFDADSSIEGAVKNVLKLFPPQLKTGE